VDFFLGRFGTNDGQWLGRHETDTRRLSIPQGSVSTRLAVSVFAREADAFDKKGVGIFVGDGDEDLGGEQVA
jgi:hypothetical protein